MWGIAGVDATVYRQCSCNEHASIIGRVGKALPQHSNPAQILGAWRKLTKKVLPYFNRLRTVRQPVPIDEFVKTFPPNRREELLRNFKNMDECTDKTAKGFVKREIKPVLDYIFKDPRWIQGCPIWMTRVCGPWLRKLAKAFRSAFTPRQEGRGFNYKDVQDGRQFIYTCGLNTNTIGEYFGRAIHTMQGRCKAGDRVVIIEDDQSRFDMHITEGAFGFLTQFYRMKISKKSVVKALQRKISKGRGTRGTKYSVPYTMQSGWPDTSVGDTIVNAAMKYDIHGFGRDWITIGCGDDSVTVTLQSEIDILGGVGSIKDKYTGLGMEVVVELKVNPLDVGFCSGRFFPWRDSYVLMPKPGRLLSKIAWDMKDRNPRDQLAWTRGISQTLLHYGNIDPVLYALGSGLADSAGNGTIITEYNPYKHQLGKHLPTDWNGVSLYYNHHYGMSIHEVVEVCSHLRTATIGDRSSNPYVRHLAELDLG